MIGDLDKLSAWIFVDPVVLGELKFMSAFNVILHLAEVHRLVAFATEGLNGILHIVAVILMQLILFLRLFPNFCGWFLSTFEAHEETAEY